MNYFISTNNEGVDLHLNFEARNDAKIITSIYCLDSDVVFNLRHDKISAGKSKVIMKVPFSPKNMVVHVSTDIPNNLKLKIVVTHLKSYNIPLGSKQKEFIEFAQAFTYGVSCGTIKPTREILSSKSGTFKIALYPTILDDYGRHKATPCQIGKDSGIIQCDNALFTNHTIAGQMALLCHEYAHFYENPRYNLPAKSEEGADMYGLRMFLASGYGESEYVNAFKNAFKRVDTNQNRERIKNIHHWASEISQGKIYGKPY